MSYKVNFTTSPPGGKVFRRFLPGGVNPILIGTAPTSFTFPQDGVAHEITATLAGHEQASSIVVSKSFENSTVNIPLTSTGGAGDDDGDSQGEDPENSVRLAPNIIAIRGNDTPADDWIAPNLITIPSGATLFADDSGIPDVTKTSPNSFIWKRVDRKRVKITKEGFFDENINFPSSMQGFFWTVTIDLRASTQTGIYGFTSSPSNAVIFVDQDQAGFTPVEVEREAGSIHTVTATLQNHLDNTKTLTWPTRVTEPFNFLMTPTTEVSPEMQIWINQGYTQIQAEKIVEFEEANQINITPQLADTVLLDANLISIDDIDLLVRNWRGLIDNIQAGNFNLAFDNLQRIFTSPKYEERPELVGLVMPIGPASTLLSPAILAKLGTRASLLTRTGTIGRNLLAAAKANPLIAIFALTEIPQLLIMGVFASDDIKDILGLTPGDAPIQLNVLNSNFRSLIFTFRDQINSGDVQGAKTTWDAMFEISLEYKSIIDDKRESLGNVGLLETSEVILEGMNVWLQSGEAKLVEEGEGPTIPPEDMVTLTINSTPTSARIFVDNIFSFEETNTIILVTPGPHKITLKKTGFIDDEFDIDFPAASSETFDRILEETDEISSMVTLTINSNPSQAKIYIDNVYTFEDTNTTIQVSPGPHTLTLKKTGFEDRQVPFDLKAGENKSFTFELVEIPSDPLPAKAKVLITSIPSNGDIYINGKFQFVTTPFTTFLDSGDYVIRVQKSGFQPQEIDLFLDPNDNIVLPFSLTPFSADEDPTQDIPPTVIFPPNIPTTQLPPGGIIIIPEGQIPPSNFSLLDPPFSDFVPGGSVSPAARKEIMINIETTDLLPWKGRIYSIAYKDLSNINSSTVVLTNNNERELIEQFIQVIENGDFKRIVGYNLAFDYRYIFAKLWLYRLQSITLKEAKLRDVMQIMKQVKEEFVFGFQKNGTLDDWGKHLLGVGKFGSQETILREFIAGNFDYVRAFQERQIDLTLSLYNLARFSFAEGFIEAPSPILESALANNPSNPGQGEENTQTKECKNCLQLNPLDSSKCLVCGDPL